MKNPHLIPICAFILVISALLPKPTHQALISRINKGSTPEIFDNGHIIPHATFQSILQACQDVGQSGYNKLQNILQEIQANDDKIRAMAGRNPNGDPYTRRKIHSLVVSTKDEVHDAFLEENAVPVGDPQGIATNLWETTNIFDVLIIRRDDNRNFESLKRVQRSIAAAVDDKNRPVHFQAKYIRPDGIQPDFQKAEVTLLKAQQANDGGWSGNPDGSGGPGRGDGSGGLESGNLQMGLSSFGQGSRGNSLNSGKSSFGGGRISGYNGNGGSGMGRFGTTGVDLAVPIASLNSFHAAIIPASSGKSPWLPIIVPLGYPRLSIRGK